MLLLYYALLKESNGIMIITINTLGLVIETFYLTVYLIYAHRKARIYTAKLLGLFNLGFFALIVVTTMVFVDGSDHQKMISKGGMRESVVGWICGIFSVCVFAAPLTVIRMVIRTKSVEFMPFWLSFSLTFCAVFWFLFGFLIKDFYIALPNVLGFGFGVAQMILYAIYKDSSKKKQKNVDVVIKESDIMQLQELGVDIKLAKNDKIEHDSNAFEHQNKADQVIQVIVEEMVQVKENEGNHIINEDDDGKSLALGIPPRGNHGNV